MIRLVFRLLGLSCLCACLGGSLLADEARTDSQPFLRLRKDDRQRPVRMETAVVRYRKAGQSQDSERYVDLVGAIHIGERLYYEELNRMFRNYDAVLYELVAPAESSVPQPGRRSGHPVGLMQVAMKDLLELEYQLDCVDYGKGNFVHADLTPDEFSKSMADRSESLTKMFFRLMGQGLAQQSKDPARSSDLALFSALFSRDRARELKRTLALQFEQMETALLVLDGPQGSTIITERNKRALEVLDHQQRAGKRRLAIFYGAAHLPDFDRKLRTELGYVPDNTRWVVAWRMDSDQSAPANPAAK